jgi:hypothetical protein
MNLPQKKKSISMKQKFKISFSTALWIPLIVFGGCNNISNRQEVPNQKEASSKIEKADKYSFTVEDSIKFFSNSFAINGEIQSQLILTVDSLKKMNVVALDTLNIVCQSGAIMNQSKSSRGVLLKNILSKAKVKQQNHGDRNFYIVARASDGCKATFSWAEIFNDPTVENTYIIFEEKTQLKIKNRSKSVEL